jgi:hypothetical protein
MSKKKDRNNKPRRERHHLYPKFKSQVEGKQPNSTPNNLLLISFEKHHDGLNKLFPNTSDLDEQIEILVRMARAKKYHLVNSRITRWYKILDT